MSIQTGATRRSMKVMVFTTGDVYSVTDRTIALDGRSTVVRHSAILERSVFRKKKKCPSV